MRLQRGMRRHAAREVVVEIANRGAAVEQPGDVVAIAVVRQVEHRHATIRIGIHAREQANVALDARHERTALAFDEPKLLQGAKAVRVAVEYVDMRRAFAPWNRRVGTAMRVGRIVRCQCVVVRHHTALSFRY